MKKILIIGAIALVVFGCVLAAGCTSNTTTTTEDFAVGTWTLPNGTTVTFGEDFKGVMTAGDKTFNFTWKKNADGKYQVNREDGVQAIWTLDTVKGIMTNDDGNILTKQTANSSGSILDNELVSANTKITLDSNGGTSDGSVVYFSRGYNINSTKYKDFVPAKKIDAESGKEYICTGYFTEKEGGTKVLFSNGKLVSGTVPDIVNNGSWAYQGSTLTLYAQWTDSVQQPPLIQLEP